MDNVSTQLNPQHRYMYFYFVEYDYCYWQKLHLCHLAVGSGATFVSLSVYALRELVQEY